MLGEILSGPRMDFIRIKVRKQVFNSTNIVDIFDIWLLVPRLGMLV